MQAAKRRRRIGEVCREDVVRSQVRGDAEAQEQEGDNDDGKGGPADEHDVGRDHDRLRQDQGLGPAETGLQSLADRSGGDEADGVRDEDERDDRVAYLIVLFHIGNQGARGCIVQPVSEIHEASTQESPLVDWRVCPGLHDVGGIVIFRAGWARHFQFMETSWCLGADGCDWSGGCTTAGGPAQFVKLESGG